MRRIYLSPQGTPRESSADERSHYGTAKAILGQSWTGDTEDSYSEMWRRGWVRVVEFEDRVYAEKYLNGRPVPFQTLTREQKVWLEDKKFMQGKVLYWNDEVFESTREHKSNARRHAEILVSELIS